MDATNEDTTARQVAVRVLGVSMRERSAVVPNVPTVIEAGVPGFESIGWFGFMAPAGTPSVIIDRLATETARVLQEPATRDRILATGNEPWTTTPAEFAAFIRTEIGNWRRVVRESGAKAD